MSGGIRGLAQLEALDERLGQLSQTAYRAAEPAAEALLAVAQAGWADGKAPDGTAWHRTVKGRIALVTATARATASAKLGKVVLKLPEVLRFHQWAKNPRRQRQVVPLRGDRLPAAWRQALEDAWRAELERLMEVR